MFCRYLANAIRRRLRTIGITSKFVASSGAAAILGNGSTVHNLVDMPISMKEDFNVRWKSEVQKRIGGAKLIILDEISLVSPRLLSALDQRLRAVFDGTKSFGGLHFIALGDFCQLKVVSDLPLYEGLVQHAAGKVVTLSNALNPRVDENNGIALFGGLRRVNLTTQHRSKDEKHKRLIKSIRDPNVMYPLTEEDIVLNIGELTVEEAKNFCWQNAIFICQTNAERRLYNEFGIKNFALRTKQPIFSWTCPNGGLATNLDSQDRLCGGQSLYGLGYTTKGYFLIGMPVQITQNIAVSQGIANGASAVVVSITARGKNTSSNERIRLPPREKFLPGQDISIPIPHSVNVVLKKDWEKAVREHFKWDKTVVLDEQEFDPSVVKVPTACLIALPLITEYPSAKNTGRKIRWKGHAYTPGFAMTYHKAQGQTFGCHLIISANKTSSGSVPTIAQVYVALSRVTHLNRLRFMPLENGRVKELSQLSYPHNLTMWAKNYTPGLVDLVVDGTLNVDGRTVKVWCGKQGQSRSLEVYSSGPSSLSTPEKPSTKLRLCSGTALIRVIKVTHLDHHHKAHSSSASLAPCSTGLWKPAGLCTEFYAKELEAMGVLGKYNNFVAAKVTQRELRQLCNTLCIRYCQDDKSCALKQRLLPTWEKARARAKMMKMKWNTKENKNKTTPLPDVMKHIDRHEWCPLCSLPSWNRFNEVSVGDHRRVIGTGFGQRKKFTRFCGDILVKKTPRSRLTTAVAAQMAAWRGAKTTTTARKRSTKTPATEANRSRDEIGADSRNAKRLKTAKKTLGKREQDPKDVGARKRRKVSTSANVHRVLEFRVPGYSSS